MSLSLLESDFERVCFNDRVIDVIIIDDEEPPIEELGKHTCARVCRCVNLCVCAWVRVWMCGWMWMCMSRGVSFIKASIEL